MSTEVDLEKKIRFIENDVAYVLKLIAAFILIVVGIVGLIFPIVPDWILILFGLILLDVKGKIRRKIVSWLPEGWRKKAQKFLRVKLKKFKKERKE